MKTEGYGTGSSTITTSRTRFGSELLPGRDGPPDFYEPVDTASSGRYAAARLSGRLGRRARFVACSGGADSMIRTCGMCDFGAGHLRTGLVQLFIAFLGVSIMGFGGAVPWARSMVVDAQVADAYDSARPGAGPGRRDGNIVDLSVIVGDRSRRGRCGTAVAGLMIAPVALVLTLASLTHATKVWRASARRVHGVSSAARVGHGDRGRDGRSGSRMSRLRCSATPLPS